jgi:hypothetical protein
MPVKYYHATYITESFCPGNGTQYDLSLIYNQETKKYLFSWTNAPNHGRSIVLQPDGYLHYTYLGSKLNHDNHADLSAMLVWIRNVTERECGFPPDFDEKTGLYNPALLIH